MELLHQHMYAISWHLFSICIQIKKMHYFTNTKNKLLYLSSWTYFSKHKY